MTLFLINIAHEQATANSYSSQVPRIKCVSTPNTLPGPFQCSSQSPLAWRPSVFLRLTVWLSDLSGSHARLKLFRIWTVSALTALSPGPVLKRTHSSLCEGREEMKHRLSNTFFHFGEQTPSNSWMKDWWLSEFSVFNITLKQKRTKRTSLQIPQH